MKRNKIVILYKKGPPVFNYPIWHLKGQYAMILLPIGTKKMKEGYFDEEDMKQISDLMDEKFIASEGRMRAEIVASEARTGEKIDRVENNLSAEIKKNRISMTRHMQELNAKWVETNEKLDRMLARMDGMDKNMSAMRAEMDAVPKRSTR